MTAGRCCEIIQHDLQFVIRDRQPNRALSGVRVLVAYLGLIAVQHAATTASLSIRGGESIVPVYVCIAGLAMNAPKTLDRETLTRQPWLVVARYNTM